MNITEQKAQYGTTYDVGYVGFTVTRHSFIAAGISWFQHWDKIKNVPTPTHVFVITGEDETVEAFPNGVHRGTLQKYLCNPDVALLVRRPWHWTPGLGGQIAAKAAEFIGQSYGYWLIAGMAVSNSLLGRSLSWLTRGWFGRTVEKLCDGKRSQICSELTARALNAQPLLHELGILKYAEATITPMELFSDKLVFESGAIELVP